MGIVVKTMRVVQRKTFVVMRQEPELFDTLPVYKIKNVEIL